MVQAPNPQVKMNQNKILSGDLSSLMEADSMERGSIVDDGKKAKSKNVEGGTGDNRAKRRLNKKL